MTSSTSPFSLINVSQLIQAMTATNELQIAQVQDKIKINQGMSALTSQMNTLLSNLQQSISQVQTAFTTSTMTAASGNTAVVAQPQITNPAVVAPSTHTITVTQLAQSQQYYSGGGVGGSGTGVFSTSTTSLGLVDGLTFTNPTSGANFTVSVASGDDLQDIRDNINNAANNFGVTASILMTTSGLGSPQYQLVLTSSQTGSAGGFTVADSASDFNLTQTTVAQDANFTLDGGSVPITSSSNTVTNVLDGISFTLLANTGTATLTMSQNNQTLISNVQTALANLVAAYNKIMTFVDASVADNSTGAAYVHASPGNPSPTPGGVGDDALGDNTFATVQQILENGANSLFTGSGLYTTLAQIGVTLAPSQLTPSKYGVNYSTNGQLTINTDQLAAALSSNLSSVQSLLTNSSTGILANMTASINTVLNGSGGQLGVLTAENNMIAAQSTSLNAQLNTMNTNLTQTVSNLSDQLGRINGMLATMANLSKLLDAEFNGKSSGS